MGENAWRIWVLLCLVLLLGLGVSAQEEEATAEEAAAEEAAAEEYEPIDSSSCGDCHERSTHDSLFTEDLSHSVHEGLECQACHIYKDTIPHKEIPKDVFCPGCQGCRSCHDDESKEYTTHGRILVGKDPDLPKCSDCHGDHDIFPSSTKAAKTHPTNLPATCGKCHENLSITTKHDIIDNPIQIYAGSIHGQATRGGVYVAASCNDCHSTGGTAHKILSPGEAESSINHFNIPDTCGECHKGIAADYWEGVHGLRARRGETDVPVCTNCHGEHGIIETSDPRSPVSGVRVAEETCSPCHESAVLNEKYGMASGRLTTFIDSYHGLKSKAGDTHVANCGSCHGVHRILPSSHPDSTINPANLQTTCGECHPGISEKLATTPIHGVAGEGLRTTAAEIVEDFYIVVIVVIIGLMVLHWLLDLRRQIRAVLEKRPQIRRMRMDEVWQHTLLMISFIILVISGFALRFSEGWISTFFFGWEGGFELRGIIHRAAAMLFAATVLWHMVFLITSKRRGRNFIRDMWPMLSDFREFWHRILFNLGRRPTGPQFGRFSYVEKAEYWALVWGTLVMITTGLLLWFDNWFIQFLPKGVLDVALVIHYWEAWLATLAIVVWHLYSVVFSPHVYPMNPSWLTGNMPEEMYRQEHPAHADKARKETEEAIKEQIRRLAATNHVGDTDTSGADEDRLQPAATESTGHQEAGEAAASKETGGAE
jgi:cytochrome b subunit of formate dehydrogenase